MADPAKIQQIEQELAATEEKAAQLRAQLAHERGQAPAEDSRPGAAKQIERSTPVERE